MTALNTPIVFNNSTGSDSAASGCGPATAVTTSAIFSSGSNGVTVSSSTGMSVGDLIYVPANTGRKFNVIASISGTSITCDDNWDDSQNGVSIYVGGKRATLDDTDSRRLFTNDIPNDSVVEIEYTGTHYTFGSLITLKSISTTEAPVTYRGTGASRPRIQGATGNSESIRATQNVFDNLELEARSSTGQGFMSGTPFYLFNCKFIDGTSGTINLAAFIQSSASYNSNVINCQFVGKGNYGTAIRGYYVYGWYQTVNIVNCTFEGLATCVKVEEGNAFAVQNCIFKDSAIAFDVQSTNDRGGHCLTNNIFHDISGNAINFDDEHGIESSTAMNNIFSSIGGNCISASSDWNKSTTAYFDYNAFYDITGSRYNNLTAGSNDITLDVSPFVDPTASPPDFNLNNALGGGSVLRSTKYTIGG